MILRCLSVNVGILFFEILFKGVYPFVYVIFSPIKICFLQLYHPPSYRYPHDFHINSRWLGFKVRLVEVQIIHIIKIQ